MVIVRTRMATTRHPDAGTSPPRRRDSGAPDNGTAPVVSAGQLMWVIVPEPGFHAPVEPTVVALSD
jgi:hypothetical protein